jgi:ABC-type uncharacterized transport system substrate-binding protein
MGWAKVARAYDSRKYNFQIAVADDSGDTKRIVEGLQKKFPESHVLPLGEGARIPKKKRTVYFAVGPSALRRLLAQDLDGPIVSVFTSSQAYRNIVGAISGSRRTIVTAVYAEPSPFDQLRLISALYKKQVKVAVLLGDKNEYLLPTLRHAASLTNIDLMIEKISADDNLNRALNRAASIPVLLAVPDSAVYNAENIGAILLTAYRHNQSVVGFSAAFVKAGALASTYSEIEDVIAQVEDLINEFEVSGRLPEPAFPKYFNVAVNDSVAQSLNLVVDGSVRSLSRKPGREE